jgi:hypothetical protein
MSTELERLCKRKVRVEDDCVAKAKQLSRSIWDIFDALIDLSMLPIQDIPSESASRPLVDFGVLNDKWIKGLISCIKFISRFQMKSTLYSLIHHLM